ncbi:uncharacterized protein [Heptranchias perlo]|uniref:uncharacterized protein n=1 Tax=Heptranchias perlo TaxID=212740 RepID=UPI0035593E2B
MELAVFVLLLGAAVSAPVDERIINGHECRPHSQPWQVFLTYSGYRWCGGSLINHEWIVSAAHCYQPSYILEEGISAPDGNRSSSRLTWTSYCDPRSSLNLSDWNKPSTRTQSNPFIVLETSFKVTFHHWTFLEPSPSVLVAHLGEHDLSRPEGTEQRLQVSKVIAHPNYDNVNLNNDIMLLKLASSAQFNQYVRPIPLPSHCATAGTQCTTSGWGNLVTNGVKYPDVLQCLNQPILPAADCRKAYPPYFTDNMFCSGFWQGGQSTCQGDSGGPVVCDGELQGITSWGYECAMRNHPSVFVKVCNYNGWIQQTIAANSALEGDKIIDGYVCSPHSQPWQVYFTANSYRWCGGSIISEWWLLSAAHCEQPANTLVAHIGEHNTNVEEGTEQHIVAAKVIIHPLYNPRTFDNDIMLVKLSKPVQLDDYAKPIQLSRACPSPGLRCLVSGWGNLLNDGGVQYPAKLQCLDLPLLPEDICRNVYPGQITRNMFCAGFLEGGKDACQGDSGGPVVCDGKLEGIVSWGSGCAQRNFPGVYTKVCNYISWIRNTMERN